MDCEFFGRPKSKSGARRGLKRQTRLSIRHPSAPTKHDTSSQLYEKSEFGAGAAVPHDPSIRLEEQTGAKWDATADVTGATDIAAPNGNSFTEYIGKKKEAKS